MHKPACDPAIASPFSRHSQFSSRNKTAGQDDRPAPLFLLEFGALANYRGSLKFTVIWVCISTGEPFSV
jgi:hypothetical protein